MFYRHPAWGVILKPPTIASASYSTEAQQFFTRLASGISSGGGTTSDPGITRKNLYATLIDGLVSDGVWSLLDVLQIDAADTQPNSLINLKSSSYPGVIHGSCTFAANTGFTFGGTGSDYIDIGFDAGSVAGTNFVVGGVGSLGTWNVVVTSTSPSLETATADSSCDLYPRYGGSIYTRVNDAAGGSAGFANAGPYTGFLLGVRTSSTARTGYLNKVSIGTYPTPSNAGATFAGNMLQIGVIGTNQIACVVVGGNIDAVQDKLYDRLRAYMTAVGVP